MNDLDLIQFIDEEEESNDIDISKFNWDLKNIYEDFDYNKADDTNVNIPNLPNNINSDFMLTKGFWKLTFTNPINSNEISDNIARFPVTNENGYTEEKEVHITKVKLNVSDNTLDVFVDVKSNPIPIVVYYGIVYLTLITAGAIATTSVLTTVEPIIKPVTDILNSPIIYMVLLIFLLPVITNFLKKSKI